MMDKPDFSDKIALVTGASRGIGRAIALQLAAGGAHVIALAKTQGALEELDDEIKAGGGTASLITADITDRKAMAQIGPALLQRFGKLDIYVANAAILGDLAPVADISMKAWDKVMNANLTAQWHLLAMLDPLFRLSQAARIAMISTGTTTSFKPFWASYTVSKAGLEALGRTYAEEMKNTPHRVVLINPGPTRTDMRHQAVPGEDPMTLPTPEDVAGHMLPYLSADYDGIGERIDIRDLMAAGD